MQGVHLKIKGIIWLEKIVEKLELKHNVRQHEVKEIFVNKPKFRRVEKGHRPGEDVYYAAGQTNSGRYLIIFFVYKNDGRALILSGRNMTRPERKRHGRK